MVFYNKGKDSLCGYGMFKDEMFVDGCICVCEKKRSTFMWGKSEMHKKGEKVEVQTPLCLLISLFLTNTASFLLSSQYNHIYLPHSFFYLFIIPCIPLH
jgi:hypothetical protein